MRVVVEAGGDGSCTTDMPPPLSTGVGDIYKHQCQEHAHERAMELLTLSGARPPGLGARLIGFMVVGVLGNSAALVVPRLLLSGSLR